MKATFELSVLENFVTSKKCMEYDFDNEISKYEIFGSIPKQPFKNRISGISFLNSI